MYVNGNTFPSIEQVAGQYLGTGNKAESIEGEYSFQDIFNQKKEQTSVSSSIEGQIDSLTKDSKVRFSKHAGERLVDRNINLSSEQMARLEDGINKAGSKGIKESLVLLDNMAFIVSTRNNTVITAMDQTQEEENIYTNIDGAVVV